MNRLSQLAVLLVFLALLILRWVGRESVVYAGGPEVAVWRVLEELDQGQGMVGGRVLLDPGVPAGTLDLSLSTRIEGSSRPLLDSLPLRIEADGRFQSPFLPAGSATLRIRLAGELLASVEGVRVPREGAADDPRLEAIDLRGAIRAFDFDLFDAQGEPLPRAVVGWRPSRPEGDPRPYERSVPAPGGHALILAAADYIDLLVAAPGARTEEFLGVAYDREIHLREGWRLRLALPEGISPEEDGVEIEARLTLPQGDPRIAGAAERLVEAVSRVPDLVFEGGEAEVYLPELGTWQLEWVALRESSAGLHRLDLGAGNCSVEVDAGSWSRVVRPSFPISAYRAAVGAAVGAAAGSASPSGSERVR